MGHLGQKQASQSVIASSINYLYVPLSFISIFLMAINAIPFPIRYFCGGDKTLNYRPTTCSCSFYTYRNKHIMQKFQSLASNKVYELTSFDKKTL